MAARTTHEVEAWANAVSDLLLRREICQPHYEHLCLIVGEAVNGSTRSRSLVPYPGVAGAAGLGMESMKQAE